MKIFEVFLRASCLVLALACGEATPPEASTWYAECSSSSPCVQGQCICGTCTLACDSSAQCASQGQESQCYGQGSFGHELMCGERSSGGGLCLAGCADELGCADGLVCRQGLCLPEQYNVSTPTVQLPASPEDSAFMPSAEQDVLAISSTETSSSAEPPGEAAPVLTECAATLGVPTPYACRCPEESPACPSLEQALSREDCDEIWLGCGLVSVRNFGTFFSRLLYYDAQSGEPVAYVSYGDVIGGELEAMDRSIDCESAQFICSTCGVGRPSCAETEGWYPSDLGAQPL